MTYNGDFWQDVRKFGFEGSIYYENQRQKALKRACEIDEAELWLRDTPKPPIQTLKTPLPATHWSNTALWSFFSKIKP